MTANELRQKYLKFFESKGHTIIPSASLVPENDPTTLFTTAGMHPLVPYLMGENHPGGDKVVNVQKCIRTTDIDEVGDATHHTFFEMMGNWSFGDYFKKEAIEMSWEFLTSPQWLGLDKNRLAVSVFEGDDDAVFDEESFNKWKELGVSEARIAKLPKKNNWWGPAGVTGPCGPDTEMFYWTGDPDKVPESFNDDNDLWVEIWNDVFMQFNKTKEGKFEPLAKKNVDTGMGLERILAAMNGFDDNYKTELFWPIIEKIEELLGKKYEEDKKGFRIIADHLKASIFLLFEGIEPSNKDRGYVLRRLIRRAVVRINISDIDFDSNKFRLIAQVILNIYKDTYQEFKQEDKCADVLDRFSMEIRKFRATVEKGLKKLNKFLEEEKNNFWVKNEAGVWLAHNYKYNDLAKIVFDLYQTDGFPVEVTFEELKNNKLDFDKNRLKDLFQEELEKHQELSRSASAGMFKGGLADSGEETRKLHTAAHLMLAALRKILGGHVHQKGSNITAERLRFDFSHPEKLTDGQKAEVERLVNEIIFSKLPVICEEMSVDEAREKGAEGVFDSKYGDRVKVYFMGQFSKEICGGPHVENTGELGHFKIKKEESSGAGVRRIKAILE